MDFPVVTSSGVLVGRVFDTDISTSNIQTIIDEESAVSGWIAKPGGGHAIVKGDLQLKEEGLCKLVYIPVEIDIEVGDVIETSGVGGIYPKGIVIGKVIEVRKTNSEFDRYAILQPAADFKKLEEVFILKPEKYDKTGVLNNERKLVFYSFFILLFPSADDPAHYAGYTSFATLLCSRLSQHWEEQRRGGGVSFFRPLHHAVRFRTGVLCAAGYAGVLSVQLVKGYTGVWLQCPSRYIFIAYESVVHHKNIMSGDICFALRSRR